MAVFVERGHHGASFTPVEPTNPSFADTYEGVWSTKWAEAMYTDGYTAGCGTNPLIFCPDMGHLREEWPVYMARMMHGVDFVPPDPPTVSIPYTDLDPARWSYKWIGQAVADQLAQECEDEANRSDTLFRPNDATIRAEAACVMAKAKGLTPIQP
jgi:hypothetical protein